MWRLGAALAVIVATPALAHAEVGSSAYYETDNFTVDQSSDGCVLRATWSGAPVGPQEVVLAYDARGQDLSLTVISEVASLLEFEGAAELQVWFDEAGTDRSKKPWARQLFYYSKANEGFEFSTEMNSDEAASSFLDAFASSNSFGLSYEGEMFLRVPLEASAEAIAHLKLCAHERAARTAQVHSPNKLVSRGGLDAA